MLNLLCKVCKSKNLDKGKIVLNKNNVLKKRGFINNKYQSNSFSKSDWYSGIKDASEIGDIFGFSMTTENFNGDWSGRLGYCCFFGEYCQSFE